MIRQSERGEGKKKKKKYRHDSRNHDRGDRYITVGQTLCTLPPRARAARIKSRTRRCFIVYAVAQSRLCQAWYRWQWRSALSGQERKKRRILRGRRSTFLVGLKRESRLAVHCAPRSFRMSQSVTATALTILGVHTRTHAHTSRERNGRDTLGSCNPSRVLFVVPSSRRDSDSFPRFQFYRTVFVSTHVYS